MTYFMTKILLLPGILFAFVINGFATAYASDKLGDPSPRNMGKLNLSPFTHIDPFGFFLMLFCGFGWTKPVFTDSRYYKNPKRGEIIVALSGSLGNFLLAFIFLIINTVLLNVIVSNNFTAPLFIILNYATSMNVLLGLFFLLPIPPLNGFKILQNLISAKHYNILLALQNYGFYILLALILTGVLDRILSIPYNIILWAMNFLMKVPFLIFNLFK